MNADKTLVQRLLFHMIEKMSAKFSSEEPVIFTLSGSWEEPHIAVFSQIGCARPLTEEESA